MKRIETLLPILLIVPLIAALPALRAQTPELAPVVSKPVSRTIDLPGEFQPFESVSLHAKVRGYVERVLVYRGSAVKQGQLLAEIAAPEMAAGIAEAEAKVQVAESERLQAAAQLAAAQATYDRLKKAAEMPAQSPATNSSRPSSRWPPLRPWCGRNYRRELRSRRGPRSKELEGYLKITAPFDGMVTDRMVHPGALVGPGSDPVLLVVQQISRLRLVVAVPEEDSGGIVSGAHVLSVSRLIRSAFTRARSLGSRTRWTRRPARWRWNSTWSTATDRSLRVCIRL